MPRPRKSESVGSSEGFTSTEALENLTVKRGELKSPDGNSLGEPALPGVDDSQQKKVRNVAYWIIGSNRATNVREVIVSHKTLKRANAELTHLTQLFQAAYRSLSIVKVKVIKEL